MPHHVRARTQYFDTRDQSFARPTVSSDTCSTMNKPRRRITTTSKYCRLVTEAVLSLGWDVCVVARDTTLRNINILAGGAHWRLPKCPDGASVLIRCWQITEGDAIIRASTVDVASITPEKRRATRKKTNRGAGRVEKGRGGRRWRRRRRTRASLPLIGSPEINTHNSFGTRSRASLLAML